MADLSGRTLGRYHLLEKLGEGGMAMVYKAFDTRLETDVAVKVIRTERLTEETRERTLKRFEREAKALARLTHPNIVKVMDFGEYEGKPYLVMPYLSGGTLKEQLGKPMAWNEAFRILAPIARALEYAHQRDIIHRDVKASNILITDSGQPMIADFGVAKTLILEETVDLTGTGMGIGTPEYMAPEQWTGKTTARSDQYSLGVVLYEMLTGRKPYIAETPAAILLKQATEELPRPSQYVRNLPEAVEKILVKALAHDPNNRYEDIGAFARALEKMVQTSPIPKPLEKTMNTQNIMDQQDWDEIQPESRKKTEKTKSLKPAQKRGEVGEQNPIYWVMATSLIVFALIVFIVQNNRSTPPDAQAEETEIASNTPTEQTSTPTKVFLPTITPIPNQIMDSKGIQMRFVPAGEFMMGSSAESAYAECQKLYIAGTCEISWFFEEEPAHTVYLPAFYIDAYEVSNAEYHTCVKDGICNPPIDVSSVTHPTYYNDSAYGNFPVINIDWNMANQYCSWRDNARLPTEAEWEKASRSEEGNAYPWGNVFDGSKTNFCDINCAYDWANQMYDDGFAETAPIDSFPNGVSAYGVYNMSGNVWEWVADRYSESYYQKSSTSNPKGPNTGDQRVLRGGAWNSDGFSVLATDRNSYNPSLTSPYFGFRCARDVFP